MALNMSEDLGLTNGWFGTVFQAWNVEELFCFLLCSVGRIGVLNGSSTSKGMFDLSFSN